MLKQELMQFYKKTKRYMALLLSAAVISGNMTIPAMAAAPEENIISMLNESEDFTVIDPDDYSEEELAEILGEGYEEAAFGMTDEALIDGAVSDNSIEKADEVLDEYALGADAEDEKGDDDEDIDYTPDKAAIVSALDGVRSDPYVFYGDSVVAGEKSAVKLTWKISGAASYTIERLNYDGSTTTLATRLKKKVFTDNEVYENKAALAIYLLRAYGKLGENMGVYAAIPSSSILSASTGTELDSVKLSFSESGKLVKYVVERSGKKKFDAVAASYTVYSPDGAVKEENFTSGEMMGKKGSAAGRTTLSITDKSYNISDFKSNFYRVSVMLDIDGLDIKSKPSTVVKVANAKYPAPTITRISKYADDSEGITHDLCYNNGNIYILFENGTPIGIDTEKAQLVVYRGGIKGGYKKIASEFIEDLTTALDGKQRVNYVIPYDKFDPGVTYYYRAQLVYQGNGGMSEPFERTCEFAPVETTVCGENTYNSVRLSWKSDGCATRYYIYRSDDAWDTYDAAEAAMEKLGSEHYKKIGTVKNNALRDGTELTFIDRKGLELGMYHAYRIVPANKKAADFYTDTTPMALKAYPASPDTVFENPVNINKMEIAWSKAGNAATYKVQRTDIAVGGVPVFEEEDGVDFREWEFKANKVKTKKMLNDEGEEETYCYMPQEVSDNPNNPEGIVRGKTYYYRVVAACNVGDGAVMWADEEHANWTEAHTQLTAVRDMNVSLYGKSSVDNSNVVQISFKSSGKNGPKVDGLFDYERVHHYEIVSSTTAAGLDTATPMTIDGKTFSYTTTSGAKNESIMNNPDLKLFKNVRGVKRGSVYYFAVRPVFEDGNTVIKSKWRRIKFVLPVEVFVYPEGAGRKAANSMNKRTEIESNGKKRFIVDFEPYDTTYTPVSVTLSNTSYFKLNYQYRDEENKSVSKTGMTSISRVTLDKDSSGRQWFEVTCGYVSSTATVVPICTLTVTAHKADAKGDIKDQLVKTYYLKGKKAAPTTTTR